MSSLSTPVQSTDPTVTCMGLPSHATPRCHTGNSPFDLPIPEGVFLYPFMGMEINKEDALHDTQQLHQVGQTCNSLSKLESACHRPPGGNLFWLSQNSSGVVPKLLVKVKDLTTTQSITVLDI